MSMPTTSNNNEDRKFFKARNGREDTFDFTIEGLRDSLDDRAWDGHRRWDGRAHRRSIMNSERNGEIKENFA